MTGKERTLRAFEFRNPDRIPLCVSIDRDNAFNAAAAEELSVDSTSDMVIVHNGDSDFRPGTEGEDVGGGVWKTTGYTFGEVAVNPLADWTSWDEWLARVPDWSLPRRYDAARAARAAPSAAKSSRTTAEARASSDDGPARVWAKATQPEAKATAAVSAMIAARAVAPWRRLRVAVFIASILPRPEPPGRPNPRPGPGRSAWRPRLCPCRPGFGRRPARPPPGPSARPA